MGDIEETVTRLRTQGSDDATTEAKLGVGGVGKDVWRTVSAFANSVQGGQIIFGLDESNGFSVTQDLDPVKVTDAIVTGLGDRDRQTVKVLPQPKYVINTELLEAGRVVVVDVEPLTPLNSMEPGPCHVVAQGIQGGSYKRVADQNQKLSDQEIYNIRTRWKPQPVDKEAIPGMVVDDLDEDLVDELFRNVRSTGSRALERTTNDAEKLERLSVTNREGQVTLAGGLTLGQYPQQFFPRFVIDVTVHPQDSKEVIGQTRFLDRKVCDGPIPYMIQDAITRVLSNLKQIHVVRGSHGTDEPEIPEDVLREAITNAVMHRDYSHHSMGERVSVDIFPDRVEVTSPGGLTGDRTTQNLDDGQSVTRNPALANLLRITPIPEQRGVIAETQGGGIAKMKAGMRQQGLPQPEFTVNVSSVKVTLHRHGLLDTQTSLWLETLPGAGRREQQENLALALFRHRGSLTVQEIRKVLGQDSDDVRVLLGNLMGDGLITGTGDGPFNLLDALGVVPSVANSTGLTESELQVLDVLSRNQEKNIRQIAEELGRTLDSLRPILRNLVDAGQVTATAPPQSRKRAYLKAPDDH